MHESDDELVQFRYVQQLDPDSGGVIFTRLDYRARRIRLVLGLPLVGPWGPWRDTNSVVHYE